MAAPVIPVSAVAAWMGVLFQLPAARSLIEGPEKAPRGGD